MKKTSKKPETGVGSTAPVVDAERTITLLPCPFCGHAPRLRSGKVKCVNQQCKVQPKIQAWYVQGYDHLAAADWNGRVGSGGAGGRKRVASKRRITAEQWWGEAGRAAR